MKSGEKKIRILRLLWAEFVTDRQVRQVIVCRMLKLSISLYNAGIGRNNNNNNNNNNN